MKINVWSDAYGVETISCKLKYEYDISAVTFFLSPVIGMASDRMTLQIGKRRPMMVIGCTGLWYVKQCNKGKSLMLNW